jgi:hypothetical protein
MAEARELFAQIDLLVQIYCLFTLFVVKEISLFKILFVWEHCLFFIFVNPVFLSIRFDVFLVSLMVKFDVVLVFLMVKFNVVLVFLMVKFNVVLVSLMVKFNVVLVIFSFRLLELNFIV